MGLAAIGQEDELVKLLNSKDLPVKCAAIVALGQLSKAKGGASLALVQSMAEDPKVRVAAVTALGEMGSRGAALVEDMADLVSDSDVEVRLAAVKTLGKFGEETAPFLCILED